MSALIAGPVWKVARYTSAAPMFFKECDNYVDGGVLANNPCESGMTHIQNFYRLQGQKLPIAVVVSVGTGVYPAEKLGKVDIFGKHGLKLDSLMKRAQNLISLLSNAVSCISVTPITGFYVHVTVRRMQKVRGLKYTATNMHRWECMSVYRSFPQPKVRENTQECTASPYCTPTCVMIGLYFTA